MNFFKLPHIGEGIENVVIADIHVKENDSVSKDDDILLVETDKASMEIPIDLNCKIKKVLVNIGDSVSPGQNILEILLEDSNQSSLISDSKESFTNPLKSESIEFPDINTNIQKENPIKQNNDIPERDINKKNILSHASPSIRKLARELGCEINNIIGTGQNNRIIKQDIYNYLQNSKLENNESSKKSNLYDSLSKHGDIEKKQLNSIRKTAAKKLLNASNTIPHVTQFDEVDITELDKVVKLLKKVNTDTNAKVSFIPFFIKAACKILKEIPIFNASFNTDDNQSFINKKYYNIGIAVNTKNGLVVPVIKNVDKKSIKKIAIELNILIEKARDGKLSLDEMSGGCLTISSLGNLGGTNFTPIINPPESSILGISKIQIKPIYMNKKFIARKMLPIALSYDHRVINGADAVSFTNLFSKLINEPSEL
mgnify:CR=1 FL=1